MLLREFLRILSMTMNASGVDGFAFTAEPKPRRPAPQPLTAASQESQGGAR